MGGGQSCCSNSSGHLPYHNDVWYSSDGVNWSQATSSFLVSGGVGGRSDFGLTVFNNKMWVVAGWTLVTSSEVYYSSDGSTWTQSTSNLGAGSYGHSAASTSSMIWIFGGRYGSSNLSWYSSDGITWSSISFPSGTWTFSDSNNVIYDGAIWLAGANKVWKLKY